MTSPPGPLDPATAQLAAAVAALIKAIRVRTDSLSYTGVLAVAVGQSRLYNDTGRTLLIKSIRASVGTAPTGAAITMDVNLNGTTIYTTQANRPTIAVSTTTVKSTNPDVTAWPDGGYLSVDVDVVGSTVKGSDLSVQIVSS